MLSELQAKSYVEYILSLLVKSLLEVREDEVWGGGEAYWLRVGYSVSSGIRWREKESIVKILQWWMGSFCVLASPHPLQMMQELY